jgi:hypothetical protein
MKFFTILSLVNLITVIANAQFSGKLDSVVFFKSIKFGQSIPKEFFQDCPGVNDYGSKYQLIFDSLDIVVKTSMQTFLMFSALHFQVLKLLRIRKDK